MADSRTYNSKTKKWETRSVADWTPQERKQYGVSGTGNIDQRTANAILRQRRAQKMGAPTEEEISQAGDKAYNSNPGAGGGGGKATDPYAGLLKALRSLGDYSAGNINSSMDSLVSTLQEQKNPFADFKAQQTQTTPELSQLLQSQGVSQDPLQQFATAMNAQNQNQATAFQNQADIMSKIYGANQTGAISDVGQQRSDLLNQLQAGVFGSGAKLMGKKAPNRDAVMNMILQAMKVGK